MKATEPWRLPSPKIFALFLTAVVSAGCSAVQSVDVTKASADARKDAYLNYSIAKSFFTIQITSAPSATPVPTTSASATPPAPPAAPGAATAWTINGTLTSGGAGAAGSAKADSNSSSTDSGRCSVLSAEYTAAQTEVAGEISSYKTLTVRLAQLVAGKPAHGDSPAKLAKDLEGYVDIVSDLNYLLLISENGGTTVGGASGVYDEIVSQCPAKVGVTVQQSIVPDPTRTFALKQRTNIFYTDALTLSTDANGFLTNGSPTTTSQVTAVASAVANDIGLAYAPAISHVLPAPTPAPAPQAVPPKGHRAAPVCIPGSLACLLQQIHNLAHSNASNGPGMAQKILADLITPGSLANLPSAALPLTLYVPIDELDSGKLSEKHQETLSKYALDIRFDCSQRSGTPLPDGIPENAPAKNDWGGPSKEGVYDGLVVSASHACKFSAIQNRPISDPAKGAAATQPVIVTQSYLWAQDNRDLVILPTDRGFLVARSVSYTFTNGQATGVTDSRPSEALAVVSFPGTVVGAFFSGVTSAFTNGQTVTNGKTADIDAETANLTAQANYLAAQAALQKAKSPPSTSSD